jgi:hypothetical protein
MTENIKLTEDDLICWPYHEYYLIQILNGEYSVSEAREDLLSLVGSKYDPRILTTQDTTNGNSTQFLR